MTFPFFCSDAPIGCFLFSLVRNLVVHLPSSVIKDPKYENVFNCTSCSFWMSIQHGMSLLWFCRRWSIGCICGRLGLGPPTPVALPLKWPAGWCHQHRKGSWSFALQFVVYLEIHQGSPSSSSLLEYRTSTEKEYTLSDSFLNTKPFWSSSHHFGLASCFMFLVQLGQQLNQVPRISHVHHSQPELIIRDSQTLSWSRQSTCIVVAAARVFCASYCEIRDLVYCSPFCQNPT